MRASIGSNPDASDLAVHWLVLLCYACLVEGFNPTPGPECGVCFYHVAQVSFGDSTVFLESKYTLQLDEWKTLNCRV